MQWIASGSRDGLRPSRAHRAVSRILLAVMALALAAPAGAAPGTHLPRSTSADTALEEVPSPDGKRVAFQLFERGDHTYVGVANADGAIRWQKDAGIRPLVSTHWSADGAALLVVTDCTQKTAELKAGKPGTASWLVVLDAADGHPLAQGDLDTDVLALQAKLPEAVGAAHVIEKLTLSDGTVAATIKHRGREVSGECPLARLKPAGAGK